MLCDDVRERRGREERERGEGEEGGRGEERERRGEERERTYTLCMSQMNLCHTASHFPCDKCFTFTERGDNSRL